MFWYKNRLCNQIFAILSAYSDILSEPSIHGCYNRITHHIYQFITIVIIMFIIHVIIFECLKLSLAII